MSTQPQPQSGQRFLDCSENLGKNQEQNHGRVFQLIMNIAGGLMIATTYILTVLEGAGADDLTRVSLPLMFGYMIGAILLLLGNIARTPLSVIALIPFAAAVNIVLGQIIGFSGIPLYLDSIATILIGYLAGPLAGMLTGIMTNLAWGLTINPSTIPFTTGAAVVGLISGFAGRTGFFRRLWTTLLAGCGTGIVAGFMGAPIAAFIYGGGQGFGTGSLVAAFQATGQSLLAATTFQSLLSDLLDKTIAFALVWAIAKTIPARVKTELACQ